MLQDNLLHVYQKEPTPVVIASFGYEEDFGKDFLQTVRNQATWTTIDVRSWLARDPAATIKHNENGAHPQTQKAVFGQQGYFKCFESVMNYVTDGKHAIGLGCKAGRHRSDTIARHVVDALNYLEDSVCINFGVCLDRVASHTHHTFIKQGRRPTM